MSQQLGRVLAAVGLTAALLLVAAAPSRAAGFAKPVVSVDLLGRAWSWLESLLPAAPPAARPVQRKTTTGTTPIPVGPPPAPPAGGGQGSMIDPEGRP